LDDLETKETADGGEKVFAGSVGVLEEEGIDVEDE
jgi:hypothetical protein